jgi:L-serine dehydratase
MKDRAISIMDLFQIGVGPSSSHTVGPMKAAFRFAQSALASGLSPARVQCTIYGSLALTGIGHATDKAILLGLSGHLPDTVDPDAIELLVAEIREQHEMLFGGAVQIKFDANRDLLFNRKPLAAHPNGMDFELTAADGRVFAERYYSVGGGEIVREGDNAQERNIALPLAFDSGAALIALCDEHQLSIADIVRRNEVSWRDAEESDAFVERIRQTMLVCIDSGCRSTDTHLPGNLNVRKRARALNETLLARADTAGAAQSFEWVSLWALAVNEENACGRRIVTSPTNGAAGVIPAVLKYYERFVVGATRAGSRDFLYTAAGIGFLYKKRASISAAEMGCQGEVGVACSMAAGGLAAAMGGTPRQVENAAEIGMEHNLGLTCDPIGGLVQIPCIERNTMGAVKAINAAYLALSGDGTHVVSLDAVIETMRQTGLDMKSKYKETSLGGLAVNFVEC